MVEDGISTNSCKSGGGFQRLNSFLEGNLNSLPDQAKIMMFLVVFDGFMPGRGGFPRPN